MKDQSKPNSAHAPSLFEGFLPPLSPSCNSSAGSSQTRRAPPQAAVVKNESEGYRVSLVTDARASKSSNYCVGRTELEQLRHDVCKFSSPPRSFREFSVNSPSFFVPLFLRLVHLVAGSSFCCELVHQARAFGLSGPHSPHRSSSLVQVASANPY